MWTRIRFCKAGKDSAKLSEAKVERGATGGPWFNVAKEILNGAIKHGVKSPFRCDWF